MIDNTASGASVQTVSGGVLDRRAKRDTSVSDRTRDRILDGVADNTTLAYKRQWARFEAWCAEQDRTAMPATPETLAEYVVTMTDAEFGVPTVSQAISAIRTLHELRGFERPKDSAARLALRAHRRDRAAAGHRARKAPPVVVDALRKMVEVCDPGTAAGARNRLLLVLGLVMMARRSELADLMFSDVSESEDGLEVFVRKSKGDQDAKGATVAVPRGQYAGTDPVRLLSAWREAMASQGLPAEGYLLRGVDRHGRIGDSISTSTINRVVRAVAVRAGVPNAERFTAHGLRAGGATSAYRAGASPSEIGGQGRWADNSAVVLGYIRSVDRWRDNPMKGIGL